MTDLSEAYSDRRQREHDRRVAEDAEREAKAAEEAARRERAPVPCGSGRVVKI